MASLGITQGRHLPGLGGYGVPVLSFVAGVLLWELLFGLFKVPAYLFPSPSAIVQVFFGGKIDWVHQTLITLNEALTGFVLGVLVGFGIALVITLSPILN